MQLSEILDKTGGLKSIARELNLNESDAAKAAAALGFHPVFGWIPTMGTH